MTRLHRPESIRLSENLYEYTPVLSAEGAHRYNPVLHTRTRIAFPELTPVDDLSPKPVANLSPKKNNSSLPSWVVKLGHSYGAPLNIGHPRSLVSHSNLRVFGDMKTKHKLRFARPARPASAPLRSSEKVDVEAWREKQVSVDDLTGTPLMSSLSGDYMRGAPISALRAREATDASSLNVSKRAKGQPPKRLLRRKRSLPKQPSSGSNSKEESSNFAEQMLAFESRIRQDQDLVVTKTRPTPLKTPPPSKQEQFVAPVQSAELPSSPTQVIRLVQSNMKACQYLEAIVMIDHALGCGGFDKEILSELHRLRGVLNHRHGTACGSPAEDYVQAIALNPHAGAAYHDRADYYFYVKGEVYKALEDYSSAIEKNVNSADAHYSRGEVRLKLANLQGAWEDFAAALKIQPSHTGAQMNIAEVLISIAESQLEKARSALGDVGKVKFKGIRPPAAPELSQDGHTAIQTIKVLMQEHLLLHVDILAKSMKEDQLPQVVRQARCCKARLVQLGLSQDRIHVEPVMVGKGNKFTDLGVFFEPCVAKDVYLRPTKVAAVTGSE